MGDYVVLVTLPGTEERFSKLAAGPVTVGRGEDCDIRLSYPTISRRNARIELDSEGRFVIRDLNSRNGTTVDGEIYHDSEAVVAGKATVQIGPYVLTLAPAGELDSTLTVAPHVRPGGRFKLDRGLRAVLLGDEIVVERLSPLEYRMLDHLDASAPNVVENSALGDHLWGDGQWDIYMLHNLIRRFRRKLEERGVPPEDHLVTVPGVGYRLA